MRSTPRILLASFCLVVCAVGRAAVICNVSSSPVAFGTYDPLVPTPDDSTGTVSVTCSLTKPDTVVVPFTLSANPGGSGNYTNRGLASGASTLNYNLYTDSTRVNVWGDGSDGSNSINGSVGLGHGLGNNGTKTVNFTSYGRIPAGQEPTPGTYTDTLIVTVTW